MKFLTCRCTKMMFCLKLSPPDNFWKKKNQWIRYEKMSDLQIQFVNVNFLLPDNEILEFIPNLIAYRSGTAKILTSSFQFPQSIRRKLHIHVNKMKSSKSFWKKKISCLFLFCKLFRNPVLPGHFRQISPISKNFIAKIATA